MDMKLLPVNYCHQKRLGWNHVFLNHGFTINFVPHVNNILATTLAATMVGNKLCLFYAMELSGY